MLREGTALDCGIFMVLMARGMAFFVIMMDQDKRPVLLPHPSDPIPRGGGGKESPLHFSHGAVLRDLAF